MRVRTFREDLHERRHFEGVYLALDAVDRAVTLDDIKGVYFAHAAELRQVMARLAPELDADDLLQELFLIVLRKPEQLSTVDSPRAWLYGIALKLATTRRRTARARRFFGLEVTFATPALDSSSRTLEQRDAQRRISKALEGLSPTKRETFVLFELQGLTGTEVAQALGVPEKTVWTRLHQTRKEVLAALERQLLVEARTSGLTRGEIQP